MFVPIILGSDKTTVSVATGQNEYYPLYLSIGNVHNNVCRAHRDAVTVTAFLSLPKSTLLPPGTQQGYLNSLRHSGQEIQTQYSLRQVQKTTLPFVNCIYSPVRPSWDDNAGGCYLSRSSF